MVKKVTVALFVLALAVSLTAPASAQKEKEKGKPGRWEGRVTVISKEKSLMEVRSSSYQLTRTVVFDASTQWVSQEHGAKKTNPITMSDVKEGDRVICIGTFGKDNALHATLISKRLTPPAIH